MFENMFILTLLNVDSHIILLVFNGTQSTNGKRYLARELKFNRSSKWKFVIFHSNVPTSSFGFCLF